MALDISKNLNNEENLKTAYNEFRGKKNLDPINFNDPVRSVHFTKFCMECLLECF